MNTTSTRPFSNTLPLDVQADIQAVVDSLTTGHPVDAEVAKRIQERSEKITEEVFKRHGLLDIGVPAIRELRGPLPE